MKRKSKSSTNPKSLPNRLHHKHSTTKSFYSSSHLLSHSFSTVNNSPRVKKHYDAIVVGGGIAGAAAAVGLTRKDLASVAQRKAIETHLSTSPASKLNVLVVEKENDFCFHSTGRSAAIYSEVYGSPSIRVLSSATKPFYYTPQEVGMVPEGYDGSNLVTRRSSLWVATKSSYDDMMELYHETKTRVPSLVPIELEEAYQMVPALRKPSLPQATFDYRELDGLYGDDDNDYTPVAVLLEKDSADMDVNAIHSAMTKMAISNGAEFKSNMELKHAKNNTSHRASGTPQWTLTFLDHSHSDPNYELEVTADTVVNASGAWGDEVAAILGTQKVGLEPRVRTVIQFQPTEFNSTEFPNAIEHFDRWPNVFDMHDRYYYKSDAGRVLASPCDEILSPPMDVQPDDLSVAVCVERLQRASFFSPQHIVSKWAGLRTFAKDREFVIGFDPHVENMLWVAGLGGYGIQTAMGNARCIAGLFHQGKLPEDLIDMGLNKDHISPSRF